MSHPPSASAEADVSSTTEDPGSSGPLRVYVDVTDTLRSGWRAGIQRVVVKLVDHLATVDRGVELVPIVWSPTLQEHRRLRAGEIEDLFDARPRQVAATGAGSAAVRSRWRATLRHAAGRALRGLRRLVSHALALTRLQKPLRAARRAVLLRTVHRYEVPLALGELPPGSVLFDLDTVWNQTSVDREQLYRRTLGRGAHLAVLVYDLLPLEHPEWFERSLVEVFDATLRAQARHAQLVLAISRSSAESFARWTAREGIDAAAAVVVGLGADVAAREGTRSPTPVPQAVREGRYVLVVGTVEPRKNHGVLLDAFDEISSAVDDLQLVVVGRPGWENDATVSRLEHHPLAKSRVLWFRNADDDLLATLYRHALVVAVPSATEGFGLPVVEAFSHGVPVVASTGGALPEAGGDLAEYVEPGDVGGWAAALERYAQDPAHARRGRAALEGYEPPAWRDTAAEVAVALRRSFG